MSASAPGVHRHPIEVRFGDCDPAGIVYFPRFFDFFHQAMESWFAAHLEVDYGEVIMGRKIGFPAVHTEADFARPCAFGERIVVELRVEGMGRSSLRLAYAVRGAADPADSPPRVVGKTVVTAFDLEPSHASYRRAIPIPEGLARAIRAFGIDAPR